MTAKELQKRSERSQKLRVIQVDDNSFYVESSEGKICYRVMVDDEKADCTCGDYAKNSKTDSRFRCKHILSVLNCIPAGEVENAQFLEKIKPILDERFITNIKGKDFVLYAGVLDLAHQMGLLKLEVELLQYPTKENGKEAICKAVAVSKTGEVFQDIGDANPTNCVEMISKHLIRMSSTRAKARVFRDMTNIGMTCVEELADFNDVIGNKPSKPARQTRKPSPKKTNGKGAKGKADTKPDPKTKQKPEDKGKPETQSTEAPKSTSKKTEAPPPDPGKPEETTVPKMSEAQKRAVYNLSRRRGISVEELENMVQEAYSTSLDDLSSKDASAFIRTLQQAA